VVAVGQPYLDFKPANVFYDRGILWMIDPPEQQSQWGVLLRDFSVVSGCLRREFWKHRMLRPWRRRRRIAQGSLVEFERGYLDYQPDPSLDTAAFRLITRVFELQRVGQLMALQKGKLRLAHRAKRLGPQRTNRALLIPGILASLPVLALQARWLVRQLKRQLSLPDHDAETSAQRKLW
jgi:hypothetical protein